MTPLDPSKVVLREGLSQDVGALMTLDHAPARRILRPPEQLIGCGERDREMVEPFKNHSIACARGGARTASAEDHRRKR